MSETSKAIALSETIAKGNPMTSQKLHPTLHHIEVIYNWNTSMYHISFIQHNETETPEMIDAESIEVVHQFIKYYYQMDIQIMATPEIASLLLKRYNIIVTLDNRATFHKHNINMLVADLQYEIEKDRDNLLDFLNEMDKATYNRIRELVNRAYNNRTTER